MIDTTLEWEGCFNYIKNGKSTGKPITYRFSNKDTVFKNDTFRILMAYTAVDTFVMGGLKEDSTKKVAYGFYSGDTSAYLMYDYSFPDPTTGDTLWIDYIDSSNNLFVAVDYVFLNIPGRRKRTNVCCNYTFNNSVKFKKHIVNWVDGLGSSVGVLNNIISAKLFPFGFPNNIKREPHFFGIGKVMRGDTLIYTFPCDFDTALSVQKPEFSNPSLYFVPISNTLIITNDASRYEIKIIDLYGKVIYEQVCIDENSLYISMSEYKSGWYLIEIMDETKLTYRQKIIKH